MGCVAAISTVGINIKVIPLAYTLRTRNLPKFSATSDGR